MLATYANYTALRLPRASRGISTTAWAAARPRAARRGVIAQVWCACGVLNALLDASGNETSWERD